MRFSIIIPAHNEETDLPDCLDSCLKQSFKDYEVIVVNDGSKDGTQKIVENRQKKHETLKLVNFKQGHSAAFARTQGVKKAKGEVLVFVDADQIAPKNCLKKIDQNLKKYGADAVTWNVYGYKPKTIIAKALDLRNRVYSKKYEKTVVNETPAFIFCIKKEVFKKLGGYPKNIFYFEDGLLTQNFLNKGYKLVHDPSIVLYHKDPDTLQLYLKQANWFGKGIKTLLKTGRKKMAAKLLLINGLRGGLLLATPLIILPVFRLPLLLALTAYFSYSTYKFYLDFKHIKETLSYTCIVFLRSLLSIISFLKTK